MMAEMAIPISTPGSGTPITPKAPATAITSGKTTGRSQIAGGPRNAPHSRDRDHCDHVVESENRVREVRHRIPRRARPP
jgi:hypothetical protein